MEVQGAAQIVQVEVRGLQVQSGAQIGKNLALLLKRKDHGNADILAWKGLDSRDVDTTFRKTR